MTAENAARGIYDENGIGHLDHRRAIPGATKEVGMATATKKRPKYTDDQRALAERAMKVAGQGFGTRIGPWEISVVEKGLAGAAPSEATGLPKAALGRMAKDYKGAPDKERAALREFATQTKPIGGRELAAILTAIERS